MLYPVLACRGREAGHRLFYVVLREIGFSVLNQIDDTLMRVDILPPGGGPLAAYTDSHSHKCEEGSKNLLSVAEEMRIAGNFAEFKVKLKVQICKRLTVPRFGSTSHPLHDGLQLGDVGADGCGEISCHPFEARADLVKLDNIFFTEIHDPGASTGLLRDEAIVRENIDRFPDRRLGYSKFCGPGSF